MMWKPGILVAAAMALLIACEQKKEDVEWREYLGGPGRNHYSALDQINLSNVAQLEKVWIYHTQDSGQIQCNPIIVDGVLYGVTASVEPFALDAETGREIWRVRDSLKATWYGLRGVSYWEDKSDKRILYSKESELIALNAETGKLILTFGNSGKVSLKSGLGPGSSNQFVVSSTPGVVFEDLIIMPLRVTDDGPDPARGFIQAFNIRTGKLEWVFKTIPELGEVGYETWPPNAYKDTNIGGANNWAGMAIDRYRGILYVPTGSASFDFYGASRLGENLFANTLLALDAKTGKRIWHFQFVHHDILDRDAPAPPNLITVTHNGRKIDAVAQVTKHGYVFLFDRENGKPLFDIHEVPAPQSDVPGEQSWPTQPKPVKPEPFTRSEFTPADINPYSIHQDDLLKKLTVSRYEGEFTPLSLKGTIIFPGLDGGAEWGGAAADPDGILYINSSEMPWLISLIPDNSGVNLKHSGEEIYLSRCSSCHGGDRTGNVASGYPALLGLKNRMDKVKTQNIIESGKGRMPGLKTLSNAEMKSLLAFLYNEKSSPIAEKNLATEAQESPARYKISGYTKFLDKDGYPAIKPPWGTLNAIDMNTGEYKWKKVFGEYPELTAKGIQQTGAESYGGPIVTAGGLLLIAGTKDARFKAYNKETGELVWETKLPAAGFATPSTYEVNGRQYVVIACGGTKLGAPKGESYVAYALPD
jgi:quinoprotein glucose dehydrogenase